MTRTTTTILLLALAAAPALAAAGQGPATINLKELFTVEGSKKAVIFPHHQHQEKSPCDSCHRSAKGGDALRVTIEVRSGFKNDFHQKLCWPCHIEKEVPAGKSCATCHNGP
ncbi:MAG: cytochrome C [Thermodesulfobacteriota bacterium]